MTSLRSMAPAERLAAIADPDSVVRFSAAGASPHLARYGISARDDDGVLTARARVHGLPLLIAAQDETFLGGSIGTRHAAALAALFDRARVERPPAIVMLVASGGVRLHEANPAELALARALAALLDARAAGVPVLALGAADVFGGASVVAAAADRLALLQQTRCGSFAIATFTSRVPAAPSHSAPRVHGRSTTRCSPASTGRRRTPVRRSSSSKTRPVTRRHGAPKPRDFRSFSRTMRRCLPAC